MLLECWKIHAYKDEYGAVLVIGITVHSATELHNTVLLVYSYFRYWYNYNHSKPSSYSL